MSLFGKKNRKKDVVTPEILAPGLKTLIDKQINETLNSGDFLESVQFKGDSKFIQEFIVLNVFLMAEGLDKFDIAASKIGKIIESTFDLYFNSMSMSQSEFVDFIKLRMNQYFEIRNDSYKLANLFIINVTGDRIYDIIVVKSIQFFVKGLFDYYFDFWNDFLPNVSLE